MIKLLKNKKALSPVVAAIILIAVTVAVSIAVAAWMGSMTFGFMATEELTITKAVFADGTPDTVTLTVLNTGTQNMTIVDATISGNGVTNATLTTVPTIVAVSATTDTILLNLGGSYSAGSSYLITVITSKGNSFSISATA